MFVTIIELEQIQPARDNIHRYEKGIFLELHTRKPKVVKLGKATKMNITKANMKVNLTMMKESETGTYLVNMIGNIVTENNAFNVTMNMIEKL